MCDTSTSAAFLEIHSAGRKLAASSYWEKIKTQRSAFKSTCLEVENWGTKSRQITTHGLWSAGGNHSNHRDSKESPRIPSLLVNRMQESPPGYIHLSIRLSLLVPFMCSSSCVSHRLMRKCEESESARSRATSPHSQGWERDRTTAEHTKWCPFSVIQGEKCMGVHSGSENSTFLPHSPQLSHRWCRVHLYDHLKIQPGHRWQNKREDLEGGKNKKVIYNEKRGKIAWRYSLITRKDLKEEREKMRDREQGDNHGSHIKGAEEIRMGIDDVSAH